MSSCQNGHALNNRLSFYQLFYTTLQFLHKQTLKVLHKRPMHFFHYGAILLKYNILSWENQIKFTNSCQVYKILHGMAPPPLRDFFNLMTALWFF